MGRVDLPYVHTFTDRHGKVRCYFRHKGKRYTLPLPDAPGFMPAYQRLLETIASRSVAPGKGEDTLGWLIRSYQQSPEFKKRAPRTRQEYARILGTIAAEHGTKGWRELDRRRVMEKIRDPFAENPRKADLRVMVLSAVYSWAIDRDIARSNPCRNIKRLYEPGEGHRAWTTDEIETFCKGCTDFEWLVFVLAFYTAFRASDLVALSWFQYDGVTIALRRTSKTGATTRPTVHPVLKAVLDVQSRTTGTILAREDGRPFTQNALSKLFSKGLRRMGLPSGVSLHGLKATHGTVLAEAGAGTRQIQASLTHATLAMVERYTRDAEDARLRAAAVNLLPTISRTA